MDYFGSNLKKIANQMLKNGYFW